MKKGIKIAFLGTVLAVMCGLGFAQPKTNVVFAEGEEPDISEPAPESSEEPISSSEEPVEEEFECLVFWAAKEHGKVVVDKDRGHVGDIVTITLNPDLFYLTEYVKVNGTSLVEDETIRDCYKFALVEGNNEIDVNFVIDQELLGKLSGIVEEASNKDWTNLFTVKNIITIVAWLLDGGLLIAIIRYFVKDKKLEEKLEKNSKETLQKLVPDQTKAAVTESVEKIITPLFAQTQAHMGEIEKAMAVFAKCFALSQENTPEARKAILDELTSLKIGDANTIEEVKKYIENLVAESAKTYQETLAAIRELGAKNQEIIDSTDAIVGSTSDDDGTQI